MKVRSSTRTDYRLQVTNPDNGSYISLPERSIEGPERVSYHLLKGVTSKGISVLLTYDGNKVSHFVVDISVGMGFISLILCVCRHRQNFNVVSFCYTLPYI